MFAFRFHPDKASFMIEHRHFSRHYLFFDGTSRRQIREISHFDTRRHETNEQKTADFRKGTISVRGGRPRPPRVGFDRLSLKSAHRFEVGITLT